MIARSSLAVSDEAHAAPSWLLWLTWERALYGGLFLVALSLRLALLGQWPLADAEVPTALAAWRATHGGMWRPAAYSPLLFDAQALLFSFSRVTDATARLLPALAGAVLVWMPYALRPWLGRRGALVAAALFAVAPTWLHWSRRADAPVMSALCVMLVLASAARRRETGDVRWWRVAMVSVAAGLTAGRGFFTAVVAGGVWVILAWARRRRSPAAWRAMLDACAGLGREHGLVLLVAFLALANGLGFNLGGLGASLDQVGAWARSLSPSHAALPRYHLPGNIALYEALTAGLAVVGVTQAFRRRSLVEGFLISWLGVALAAGTVLGHRASSWLPDVVLPLVLLAGRGAQGMWDRLHGRVRPTDLALAALLILPIAFAYLEVANYLFAGRQRTLWYAGVAVILAAAVWVGYVAWARRVGALASGALVLVLLLLIPTLRGSVALAYQRGLDPREPMLDGAAPSIAWRDLQRFLVSYSTRMAGDAHLLPIAYEDALDPRLAWELRDYVDVRAVPNMATEDPTAAMIVPADAGLAPVGYVGQRFRVNMRMSDGELTWRERLRWLMMRDQVGSTESEELIVWVPATMAP